jgi:hypothetical protein
MSDKNNFGSLRFTQAAATALLVLFSFPAFPQSAGTGTLTGTLTDSSGAVVPAAAVIVHNGDTGADREVTSNGAGIYVATFLQPGHYEVSAIKPGFQKVVHQNLVLQVGQTLAIDMELPCRRPRKVSL